MIFILPFLLNNCLLGKTQLSRYLSLSSFTSGQPPPCKDSHFLASQTTAFLVGPGLNLYPQLFLDNCLLGKTQFSRHLLLSFFTSGQPPPRQDPVVRTPSIFPSYQTTAFLVGPGLNFIPSITFNHIWTTAFFTRPSFPATYCYLPLLLDNHHPGRTQL